MLGGSTPTGENRTGDDGREGESMPKGDGRKQALRFAIVTVVNSVFLMLVLYLAGLLARSHTTEGYFRGIADDWKTVVPMLLVFGVALTLWNRWLRRRRMEKRRQREQDGDRSEFPVD
jgi:hypothetical protein